MNRYVLCLKENGDGFSCNVFKNKLFIEIRNQSDDPDIPECITKALACKNRKEVESFIIQFLMKSNQGTDESESFILNSDGTQTAVDLCHSHFREGEPSLNEHFSIKGVAHEETPNEMLQYVRNRSSFFVKNYKKGHDYHHTSWVNPVWLLTFINYYLTAFKNSLSHTLVGGLVLGIKPTHFCEDFNQGCLSSNDIDNTEVDSSLAI